VNVLAVAANPKATAPKPKLQSLARSIAYVMSSCGLYATFPLPVGGVEFVAFLPWGNLLSSSVCLPLTEFCNSQAFCFHAFLMSGLEMWVLDDAFGFVMIAHLVSSGTIPFLLGVTPSYCGGEGLGVVIPMLKKSKFACALLVNYSLYSRSQGDYLINVSISLGDDHVYFNMSVHPVFVSGAKSMQKVQNVCWFTRCADEAFEVEGFELKDGFLESVGIRCDVLELIEAVFAELV
jgi:hypothetical protein